MILNLIAVAFLALTPQIQTKPIEYKARITYYSHNSDKYGSRVADPNVKRAKHGITVSAHPDFKFGTEIEIPELSKQFGDGKFIVQDRGSAVTKKRAARGKAYVFDVYVEDPNLVKKYSKELPEYMDVKIIKTK